MNHADATSTESVPVGLRDEVERGHAADRRLASELGRPEPRRSTAVGGYLDTLRDGRPPTELLDQGVVARAQEGDARARAQLVEASMPLIAGTARAYRSDRVQRQELLQEGVVGLLRALERYDPSRGVPFWGYATWWVRHAMQQLVSELEGPTVLSDRALRHMARLKQAHGEAVQATGREPTRRELAERTGLDAHQVEGLLTAGRTPRTLDAPIQDGGGEGEVGMLGELIADPMAEGEYERVLAEIEIAELHDLLAGLSDRERRVLRARYGFDGDDERSLRDIGGELGLTGERVRQIEKRALGKLAASMTPTA